MNRLIITDVDGTLFDTAEVNYRAYRDICNGQGYRLTKDYYMEHMFGKHYKDYFRNMFPDADASFYENLHEQKKEVYPKYLSFAAENHHLINILNTMKKDYKLAVVSTACRQNTMDILRCFGLEDLFDLILTQEDVERVKPDPEGFLKAMEYFGVSPENTLIFEDSDVGIEGAIRSGANVMRVENGFVR